MPKEILLPSDVRKVNGRWLRDCPKCSTVISHLRRNYCANASIMKQVCKKCSNQTNHPAGMVGAVRVAWYNSFKASALSRGLKWHIDIEDVANLYDEQYGVCALSGWKIGWSEVGWNHTASLDRIDNHIGYTVDNIQLVHKIINMSRGSLSVEDFITMCESVADRVKW